MEVYGVVKKNCLEALKIARERIDEMFLTTSQGRSRG